MYASPVFCVGMNKTGTTSLRAFMEAHGYTCGDQAQGELLMRAFAKREWKPIIAFARTAAFHQDLPFSAPGTAAVLEAAFPQARFILTLRSTPLEWYRSLTSYHKRLFGHGRRIPTPSDLQAARYRYRGFAWEANRALYRSPADDPYHRESLIREYEEHRQRVQALFTGSNRLLILSVAEEDAVAKLCSFLQLEPKLTRMPWLNKNSE